MKAKLLFIGLLMLSNLAFSQEEKKAVWKLTFSGFIKSDYWYDTRQVVTTREDLFLFYPKPVQKDSLGQDINDQSCFNFSAITSRLLTNISGPDAFGAKTRGFIEGDFSGVTNNDINGFRLRHAYVNFDWKKTSLMVGQYWHPLFSVDVMPTVISLNTGAPFQPFIRNPLVTFTYKTEKFKTAFTAITQRDNTSDGPSGLSPVYIQRALIPNLNVLAQYASEPWTTGISLDAKKLRPRTLTALQFKTNESITTYAAGAWLQFKHQPWTIKAKAIYGQNLSEHLMMGAYAIHTVDSSNGAYTYTPENHLMSWFNVLFSYKKSQSGIFAGYSQNFGTTQTNNGTYYGRGFDIAKVYRFSGYSSLKIEQFMLCLELEYTRAEYGKPDAKGKFATVSPVGNFRTLMTVFYFF